MQAPVRSVVIVLPDIAPDTGPADGGAGPGFLQTPVLVEPDFLFLQAAVEPLDVAVAFRMVVSRAAAAEAY